MTLVRFEEVIHLNTDRVTDPASAGIDRFVGLEHIEPENLHIRSWGLVVDGTTFTSTFKHGQVLFGKRYAYQPKLRLPKRITISNISKVMQSSQQFIKNAL